MTAPARTRPAATERRGALALTIGDLIDGRSPGFDATRLLLALLVLVSHTWPLGGFGPEPSSPISSLLTLGGFAVAGFFAMSGMLVGRSALRRPFGAFVHARAVRIVPAYVVAVAVSGLLVAGLAWWHERGSMSGFFTLTPDGPFAYVGRAVLFPVDFSHGVRGVFVTSTPYGGTTGSSFVNGSLWTLPYEVRCYLVIGLLALSARRFGTRRVLLVATVVTLVLAVRFDRAPELTDFVLGSVADAKLVMLLLVFLTGAVVGAVADRLQVLGPAPLIALAVALLAGRNSLFLAEHVASAALALVLPTVAFALAPIGRLLRGVDLSYGMYLYAWPVQQLLAMYGLGGGAWTFVLVSAALTAVLATGSWYLVERPTMRRWRPR